MGGARNRTHSPSSKAMNQTHSPKQRRKGKAPAVRVNHIVLSLIHLQNLTNNIHIYSQIFISNIQFCEYSNNFKLFETTSDP